MDALKTSFSEIGFYWDSRSGLEALIGLIPRHRAIAEIKNLVKQHFLKTFAHWIKVHVDLSGNKKSDELEKATTERPRVDVVVQQTIRQGKRIFLARAMAK